MLAILLPDEDIQDPCLFSLVSDVLADLVLGELVVKRASDPGFIYDMVVKIGVLVQAKLGVKSWIFQRAERPKTKLTEFGLLSSAPPGDAKLRHNGYVAGLWSALSSIGRFILLAILSVRDLVITLLRASSLPHRFPAETPPSASLGSSSSPNDESDVYTSRKTNRVDAASKSSSRLEDTTLSPIISLKIWSTISHVWRIDQRIPWLRNMGLSMRRVALAGPGKVGCTNTPLDR